MKISDKYHQSISAEEYNVIDNVHITDELAKLKLPKIINQTTYRFNNFFHPFVGDFIARLNKGELADFMRSDLEIKDKEFFDTEYNIPDDHKKLKNNKPNNADYLVKGFPKTVDFSVGGPYAIYNWEIFYHIPISVAVHLSKNQRFAEAQKWFHFVFNPLTDEEVTNSDNPSARYWNFKHFRENGNPQLITQLLEDLAKGEQSEEINNLRKSIQAWQKTPFNPHAVAGFRPLAYQFDVIMKYLDNLVAWGDSLFRQFTIESLNEATQLYVLANTILGDKPQQSPNRQPRAPKTYRDIKQNLDELGNALVNDVLVDMENNTASNHATPMSSDTDNPQAAQIFTTSMRQLYFCIPSNKKLLAYWDLVADRLFKIRHCMDIEGNIRQIPLFQPSIDPGMLVKAAAAGLNIGDIISGLNQAVSNVRFPIIAQKASELINEVKAMGSQLLSAVEKGEAEKLTLIRQTQELKILGLSQDIRFLQWKESEAAIESLIKSRESTFERYKHYQRLLGKDEADFADLSSLSIEHKEITEENFDDVFGELVEQFGQDIQLDDYRKEIIGAVGSFASKVSGDIGAVDSSLGVGSSENLQLNAMEDIELNAFMPLTTATSLISSSMRIGSAFLSAVPQVSAKFQPLGTGGSISFGGTQLAAPVNTLASSVQLVSEILSYQGTRAAKLGSYKRRIDDWVLQSNLAAKELQQIGTQVISSLIREQISRAEYENHKVLIQNAEEIDDFFKQQKFSNEGLYLWMQGEVSKVFYEFYKLAFDAAKKAEATMKHELMRDDLNERQFIKFNYWDSGRKGLLSGEALALDMKRMELAYMESNKREFEITKQISLAQVSPLSLMMLRETGKCTLSLPEWLFDMDYSGHYMRRIKNVSLTIPAIVGPYTNVNCTLSLSKNEIRTSALLQDDKYDKQDEDDRFKTMLSSISSIVTSHAQNDSGMFELNFNDGRFLPFEGAGVISDWQIDMPKENNQFDFSTLSDVILHISYTARSGGELLGRAARDSFTDKLPKNTARLFSLKHEFGSEWHRFLNPEGGNDQEFVVMLKPEHFPFYIRKKIEDMKIQKMDIFVESNKKESFEANITVTTAARLTIPSIGKDPAFNNEIHHSSKKFPSDSLPSSTGELRLQLKVENDGDFKSLNDSKIDDVFILFHLGT